MACRSCLALPCRDGGSLFSTLAALCTQHRCCLVVGQTSCSACQKPSAPSPVASSGSTTNPFSSRRRSSSSRQLWALSRKPRSEERRVGKECRYRLSPYSEQNNHADEHDERAR